MGAEESGLHLALQSSSVTAGQAVVGTLHLVVITPTPASGITVTLKGVEKTQWSDRPPKDDGQSFGGKRVLLRQTYRVCDADLQPGQYSFPFSVRTPHDLPSSFAFTPKFDSRVSFAQVVGIIKYLVIAKVEVAGTAKKAKQELLVTQKMYKEITPTSDEVVAQLKTWGCWGGGRVRMRAELSKNAYTPGENATVMVDVHNEESRVGVSGLRLALYRQIRLRDKEGRTKLVFDRVTALKSKLEVAPGPKLLSALKQAIAVLIPSEACVERTVTVRSTLLDCEYFVRIEVAMNGRLMCCGEVPSIEKRLVVYQPDSEEPTPPPLQQPPQWNPVVMPALRFDAGAGVHYPRGKS